MHHLCNALICLLLWLSFFLILFYFLTLQYCIDFAIYQHESATGMHLFPILNPPPSCLPVPSHWVIPVHQPQASSIVYRTWTGVLKSILSDISIAFFVFPSAWNIFFHPFAFSLYMFLDLTWLSLIGSIYMWLFLIHLATLCLLSGAFSQFTFKVIIDGYVLIATLLVVFWLFCSSLFLSFSFVLFLGDLMTFFSVTFSFFPIYFLCIYCGFPRWY